MQRITVVSVPVSDQEAAKTFYTEQVGFKLITESRFGDELHWIQVGPADGEASLTLVTWFDSMPPGSLRGLVIDCADLQADYEAMRARGVCFLGPPEQQPGGVFAIFTDPDGNQISLRQAGSSTGEEQGLIRR
ncbi:VOC family protein [Amycolatopsis taiwanensis]|uniref:VOC family protein n=1 Tax=Amycolatopsis taiwanensis TaxID=342230 RepID=UPI000480FCF9|nr:VOC family protein [Amycolatopsis taiwanensis]